MKNKKDNIEFLNDILNILQDIFLDNTLEEINNVKSFDDEGLTKEESEFILAKLRTAQYIGDEFEMFYTIFRKIGQHIKTLK